MAAGHQRLVAEALLKAEKKLEAVKKWFSEYGYIASSFRCWKELEKILGVEAE